jgi:hypothetical protein
MRRRYRGPSEQPRPDYPVVVDWSHPLAAGLIGCYIPSYTARSPATNVPNLRDLSGAGPELAFTMNGGPMAMSPLGFAAVGIDNIGGTGWQATSLARQRPNFGVSLFTRGYKTGAGTNIGSFPMLFGCQWTNSNTAPYDSWDITNGPTDGQVNFAFNVGGTATSVAVASAIATGGSYNLGMTAQADGVAGHIRPFINGVLQTTGTPGSGAIGYGANPTLLMAGKVATNGWANMPLVCGYIWDHMLSDDFMAWLNAEPYAMLRPVRRRPAYSLGAVVAGGQARAMVLA